MNEPQRCYQHLAALTKIRCKERKMAELNSTHTCQACGCAFTRKARKDGTPRKTQKYVVCSDYCRRVVTGRNKTLNNKDWVAASIECVECGASFVQTCAKHVAFCSKACKIRNWKRLNPDRVARHEAIYQEKESASRLMVRVERIALRRIARNWRHEKQKQHSSGVCIMCGEEYTRSRAYQRVCSDVCEERYSSIRLDLLRASRRRGKAKRKARKRGVQADGINPIKVFERDRWRCHICGKKTQRSKRGTCHPSAPELEHIVSFADGGSHTWGNVACACRACNSKKGAKSFGQIGLAIPM